MWIKAVIDFFVGLVPAKDDDAMAIYSWRWKSLLLGVAALVLALYAGSFIPTFGPPYASAQTVIAVKVDFQTQIDTVNKKLDTQDGKITAMAAQQHDAQIRQLNTDLIDAKRYQCRAIDSTDKTSLPFWSSRLQDLRLTFFQLTNTRWFEPDCKTF